MASRKSNNAYYRSDDLKKPFDNIKQAMGLTGNADSNYLTNLGKVSRYEGTELDNRKKEGLAELLQKAILGKSADQAYGIANTQSYADSGLGDQRYRMTPGKLELQQQDIDTKKNIAGLQDLILKNKRHDPKTFETGDAWLRKRALGEQALSDTAMDEAASKLMLLTGQTPGMQLDASGRRRKEFDERKAAESQSKINKDISVIGWNDARRDGYKNVSAANVSKIEQETTNLLDKNGLMKSLNKDRRMEIRNRVLNNIAELDQKILTSKLGREKLDAQIAVEIEKLLTQEEKTETQWFKTATQEETLKTQEQKTAKATSLADMSAKELEKLPQKLKDEATKRTKDLDKIDKDILKLEQQTKTSASREDKVKSEQKLVNAKRMRVNVQKSVDRILGDARKILIDVQAGNWGTRTYNMLKYPNKREGKVTTAAAGGTTPQDGRMTLNPNGSVTPEEAPSLTPQDSGGGSSFGVQNIMKNLQKFFSGGESKPLTGESNKILSSLQGENTAEWKKPQIDAFIEQVVAQSGGTVSTDEAKEILKQSMSN